MEREAIKLTGAQETLLVTLYGKAMDSRSPSSVLRDREADMAVQRIDYDFRRVRMTPQGQRQIVVRAKAFDRRVRRYLDAHPDCTVLHLGCGLDTRGGRIAPPPTVRWYDIDFPDVIELRRRLYPEREGHHAIASSVTDPHLLDQIPGDTPVLVVAEGLTPYLRAADGAATLRRITGHFPGGEVLMDGYNRLSLWFMRWWLRRSFGSDGEAVAQVDWSIGDPRELERAVPGLVFDCEWWYPDEPELRRYYPLHLRLLIQGLLHTPLRRMGRGLRYHFGAGAMAGRP